MLFNSYGFIFIFLPIALIGFFYIGHQGHHRIAISWLVGASLFFYGWWNPAYLGLIIGSMLFNYAVGVSISSGGGKISQKSFLVVGVVVNLGLLVYFKYANFIVNNLDVALGIDFNLRVIILPLAISFFTFQQIAYLVDVYKGEAREYNFLHYCLFVTFFPQLIAGPIVHHREMLPQFARDILYKFHIRNFAIGLTIFIFGLFKKSVLADGVAVYATPVFEAADSGVMLTFFDAWIGVIAYTLQIYFDFSGYSDMAIGLGRMFGVRLPLNFNSPYKATNIIDFWRCWHMTLSRFLRDYLYIPLGGNRKGPLRRQVNLLITMLLGGLWHGAGWNFVIWGALHGAYLVVNHVWRSIFSVRTANNYVGQFISWAVTFIAVVVAWVPFRAETLMGAKNMWMGMIGGGGISLPVELDGRLGGVGDLLLYMGLKYEGMFVQTNIGSLKVMVVWLVVLIIIAILLPNTQQIMRRYRPAFETYVGEIRPLHFKWLEWRPTYIWAVYVVVVFILGLLGLSKVSEFLYFQF